VCWLGGGGGLGGCVGLGLGGGGVVGGGGVGVWFWGSPGEEHSAISPPVIPRRQGDFEKRLALLRRIVTFLWLYSRKRDHRCRTITSLRWRKEAFVGMGTSSPRVRGGGVVKFKSYLRG